jgi:hypothetical protein
MGSTPRTASSRNWRQSYTGYMQGVAGIGSLFVRLAAHERRLAWKVRFPDNALPIV